jgi:hypothetical protein
MFNLSEIMQAAQGGQAVNNLAQQFGLKSDQAQAAINALLPAFSVGLQNQAQNMGALSQIVGAMMGGQHTAFDDPNGHLNQRTTSAGSDVLGQLFGQGQATSAIAQQASKATGVNPGILMAMMPIVASMLMSGLFKSATNQGLGGILGQLAASMGGAGMAPGAQMPGQAGGGVLGNIIGNVMGNMMHGGAAPTPGQPGGATAPQPSAPSAAIPGMNPAMQAGLDVLTGMFNHGQQMQGAQMSALQDIFNAYTRGASR